jgi:hypothetical protein
MPPVLLTDSPNFIAVPPSNPHLRRVLDDQAYANWGAVFQDDKNAAVRGFLLTASR